MNTLHDPVCVYLCAHFLMSSHNSGNYNVGVTLGEGGGDEIVK